jgi:hypothetical protein
MGIVGVELEHRRQCLLAGSLHVGQVADKSAGSHVADAIATDQQKVIFERLFQKWWQQMVVVEPVLTEMTLEHEVLNGFVVMHLTAMAIDVEECLVVVVRRIVVVLRALVWLRVVRVDLAVVRHAAVSAVTPEVHLIVELVDFMTLMTMDRTS